MSEEPIPTDPAVRVEAKLVAARILLQDAEIGLVDHDPDVCRAAVAELEAELADLTD